MDKNTFCILPFKSIYIKPNGEVAPCCIAEDLKIKENYNTHSISDVFNSEGYKKIRKDFLNKKKPSNCNICWNKELMGVKSFRQSSNEFLGINYNINDDYSVNSDIEYIDVRLSNLCNFKCIMCSHELSSSHYGDFQKKHNIPKVLKIRENFIEELKPILSNLKYIYFAGGEPLITPEHFQILKYLHENNKNVNISYNTNLSTIKYDVNDLVSFWKDFKSVSIQISLDGLYEFGEAIRIGMNSNRIIKNILKIKKSKIPYSISYTIGNYNIKNIYTFLNQLFELKLIDTERQINFNNIVSVPYKLSIQNMNELEKNTTIKYLLDNIDLIKTENLKKDIYDLVRMLNNKKNIL